MSGDMTTTSVTTLRAELESYEKQGVGERPVYVIIENGWQAFDIVDIWYAETGSLVLTVRSSS